MNDTLRFPIGKFKMPQSIDRGQRDRYVEDISMTPHKLREAVRGLDDEQLETPYRDGGWTVRQVVHHLPDSHLNAYLRFKFALTEDAPLIMTYQEGLWAELPEAKSAPIEVSLALLESLHSRWVACIRGLPEAAFDRTYRHPEMGSMSLNQQLADYSWHGKHHVAHITGLSQRMGWK